MRNWTCKKLTKGRAEVRLVQNTTLFFSLSLRYCGELQTLGEASVPHIWQHTDHQQLQASRLFLRCFSALTSLTFLEFLLSKVQEQLLKSHSGVTRVKHINCCVYLRPSTLSLHQACCRCYAALLLNCKVMICCYLLPLCAKVFCGIDSRLCSKTTAVNSAKRCRCYNTSQSRGDYTIVQDKSICSMTAQPIWHLRRGNVWDETA